MSKQLATYFSPFSPIQTFSQEMLFKQNQVKDGIIDVNLGMKGKDADLIKKMEREILQLKEFKKENEKLEKDMDVTNKRLSTTEKERDNLKTLSS